jgi:hypothetical protein
VVEVGRLVVPVDNIAVVMLAVVAVESVLVSRVILDVCVLIFRASA